MSALQEPIGEYFKYRGISVEAVLYTNPGFVTVYVGRMNHTEVVSKVIRLPLGTDSSLLEREYSALTQLRHENVLTMYDCFWANEGKQYFLVFVTERCKTDLGKMIKARALSHKFWSEEELWTMLRTLARVLSYMQGEGIAHRDIKPDNIFYTDLGIKLGDFGSSRLAEASQLSATLAGSPLYLSPKLKQAFLQRLEQVSHQIYKSDVYSLGVTFIQISTLQVPIFLMERGMTEARIRDYIDTLQYSDEYKSVLKWMLVEEEDRRCDFIQLQNYLQPVPASPLLNPPVQPADCLSPFLICLQCQNKQERRSTQVNTVVALECQPLDHIFCCRDCLQKYLAENPGNEVCPECQKPLSTDVLNYAKIGYREWISFGARKLASYVWSSEEKPGVRPTT